MSLLLLSLLPRGELNSSRQRVSALRRGLQHRRGNRLAGAVLRKGVDRGRGGLWGCVACRHPCRNNVFEAGCPACLLLSNDAATCLTKQALQATVCGRCWRSCGRSCNRRCWRSCWGRCWRSYLCMILVRRPNTCIATLMSRVLLVL